MRNAAAIMVTLYVSLLVVSVFFVNDESAAKRPAEDAVLSNNDYFNVEKQYLHTNEMAHPTATLAPELTLSPQPTSVLTPDPCSPTLPPESALSPGPTPSPSPKPTSPPKPTSLPTPVPTLSPKPVITLSPERAASMTPDELERATFAIRILNHPGITLATIHPSGVMDSAFAYDNIYDTSLGCEAKRSRYGTAPGGSVYLNSKMLNAMLLLAEKYNFTITEIAGANHSSGSTHYSGIAFDVGTINGKYATNGATARAFVADAKKCGATYTLIERTCVHIDFR